MTHRAEQIADALATALRASTNSAIPADSIYVHRTLSLAEDQGELPAITVNVGDDAPAPEFATMDQVASRLEVITTGYAIDESEEALKRKLFAMRSAVHAELVVNSALGLTFILALGYAGAPAPVIDSSTESFCGSYEWRWEIVYWMDEDDPE